MSEGVHELVICMGSACFAHGNNRNVMVLRELIKERGLSHRVQVTGTLCQNQCKEGPNLLLDQACHCRVHEDDLPALLDEWLGRSVQ